MTLPRDKNATAFWLSAHNKASRLNYQNQTHRYLKTCCISLLHYKKYKKDWKKKSKKSKPTNFQEATEIMCDAMKLMIISKNHKYGKNNILKFDLLNRKVLSV